MHDELWPVFLPVIDLILAIIPQFVIGHRHRPPGSSRESVQCDDMIAVVDEPMKVQIHIEQECVSIDVWVDQSPQACALKECTPPMVAVGDRLSSSLGATIAEGNSRRSAGKVHLSSRRAQSDKSNSISANYSA